MFVENNIASTAGDRSLKTKQITEMAEPSAGFQSLATELLLPIFESLDVKSMLAVTATCRLFREVGYQPAMFKEHIATKQLIYDLPERTSGYLENLSQRYQDTASWAKCAHLEHVVYKLCNLKHNQLLGTNTLSYFGLNFLIREDEKAACLELSACQLHLIATRHPCLFHDRFTDTVMSLFGAGRDSLDDGCNRWSGRFLLTPLFVAAQLYRSYGELDHKRTIRALTQSSKRVTPYTERDEHVDLAGALESTCSFIWAIGLAQPTPRHGRPGSLDDVQLPQGISPPFPDLRLSFRSALTAPLQLAMPASAYESYLTSDSWTGYAYGIYATPSGLGTLKQNIRFKYLNGLYLANKPEFFPGWHRQLTARLHPETGRLFVVESFDDLTQGTRTEIEWLLFVTPFGLIGKWGTDGRWQGYMWLWKELNRPITDQVLF